MNRHQRRSQIARAAKLDPEALLEVVQGMQGVTKMTSNLEPFLKATLSELRTAVQAIEVLQQRVTELENHVGLKSTTEQVVSES